jgi:hypothetical protein
VSRVTRSEGQRSLCGTTSSDGGQFCWAQSSGRPLAARDEPTRSDNCYHVVAYNEKQTIRTDLTGEIDGFLITAGQALYWKSSGNIPSSLTPFENCGGGMIVLPLGKATSSLTIRDCAFEGNYAEEVGGGFYCRTLDHLALIGCTLIGNGAMKWAGGFFVYGGCVGVTNSRLERNKAGAWGGAIYSDYAESLTLTGCTLVSNTASGAGGIEAPSTALRCLDCVLRDNIATDWAGAGIHVSGRHASLIADRCRFIGNKTADRGGAVLNGASDSFDIGNSLFCGNVAARGGGAIWTIETDSRIVHCTSHGNRSPKGSFLMDDTQVPTGSSLEIANCIVSNEGNEISINVAAITIVYTDLLSGHGAVDNLQGALEWGPGNTDVDPCFADPGYWNPNGTPDDPNDDLWTNGDYHLKSQAGRWDPNSQSWRMDNVTSPCIDAGDPNSPVGEEPEPNGGRINMGAYGGTAQASKSYSAEAVGP